MSQVAIIASPPKRLTWFRQRIAENAWNVVPSLRKINRFQPHYRLLIQTRRFTVKTVENGTELASVLRLRHEIFYREILGRRKFFQLDYDAFDFNCDHLLITERGTGETVGTYRLIGSKFSDHFYSEGEFHMSPIRALPGKKLELGRACVKERFRNGLTLALLWKGILNYMKENGYRYLLGCSSIHTTDTYSAAVIHRNMQKFHSHPGLTGIIPRKNFRIKNLQQTIMSTPLISRDETEALIPPLLKFYLKSGAKICGEPALDRAFRCIDYLTLLDLKSMDAGIKRKYQS